MLMHSQAHTQRIVSNERSNWYQWQNLSQTQHLSIAVKCLLWSSRARASKSAKEGNDSPEDPLSTESHELTWAVKCPRASRECDERLRFLRGVSRSGACLRLAGAGADTCLLLYHSAGQGLQRILWIKKKDGQPDHPTTNQPLTTPNFRQKTEHPAHLTPNKIKNNAH